ncbi:hypothetical protein [Gimesia sp.]|uniref:hypothetical protein n=1 Tax=Gimesia sp. TaxID=2024833 RepID=UPI0032EF9B24
MMKSIEEEILEVFVTSARQTEHKARNAKVALAYYGFSNDILPTLEFISEKYSIGTRERVRQILEEFFTTNSRIKQIDGIQGAAKLVSSKPVSFWSEMKSALCKFGFIPQYYLAAHLHVLLKDLGMCEEFELYTPTGEKVARSNAAKFEQFLFVHKDVKKNVMRDIIKLRNFPSRHGMITLDALELTHFNDQEIKRLINGIPESWQCLHENQTWFLFEDRDNRLINLMEKAYCTGSSCEIERLAETLENGLRSRSSKLPFPPVAVIQQFLRSSKLTRVQNEFVTFHGEKGTLSDIENECIHFFDSIDREPVDSPKLKRHLKSLEYGDPLINKTVHNSPLIHIDKTGGRKTYQFSLVCNKDDDSTGNQKDDRYQEFVNRLKDIAELGTDAEHEANRRREQDLLREWIFGDKLCESCAICGKEFESAALRTAHKKKRSECSEAERIDPYVVMPICLFGCDYLYENKFVTIREGKVATGPEEPLSSASKEAISQIVGREVEGRWIAGKSDYFH